MLQQAALAYRQASGSQKQAILEEFATATGCAYKYAQWLLEHVEEVFAPPTTLRRRYGPEIEDVLVLVWKTLNRICAKRLIQFYQTCSKPWKKRVCATEQGASDPFALDECCHRFLGVYSKIVL